MNNSYRSVCIYTDLNSLSIGLVINLHAKKSLIKIITQDVIAWETKLKELGLESNIIVEDLSSSFEMLGFEYVLMVCGFINKFSALEQFKYYLTKSDFKNKKIMALFPYELDSAVMKTIKPLKNSAIIFVGDLLGESLDRNSNLTVNQKITDILRKGKIVLGIGQMFYPLETEMVSKIIVKWLFLGERYSKRTLLIGPKILSIEFWKSVAMVIPNIKVVYDTDLPSRILPYVQESKRINTNFDSLIQKTLKSLNTAKPETQKDFKKQTQTKTKKTNKPLRYVLLGFLFVLLIPWISIAISGISYWVAYKSLLAEKYAFSQKLLSFSKTTLLLGKSESQILKNIPILGIPYRETEFVSYLGINFSDVIKNTIPLVVSTKTLTQNMLGNNIYDVNEPVAGIKTSMEYLYQQLSLIELDVKTYAEDGVYTANRFLSIFDLEEYKNLSQQGIGLANNLPGILGAKINKDYLVLFQNNMELRPGGGFIGSYGIASFGGGKLNGLSVNDIYSADGQLRGHIEPPEPIKKYLDEANWWFRDSNWDPDFIVNAKRAEWFLEKEMGQEVDGVIAIDLTPIKNILKVTGPIFLADYNLTITSENLYEKTQEEAQGEFFPGSRRKASFLTALSRVLINKIAEMDTRQRIGVLKSVYDGLQGRNIQVYLHENEPQSAISKLNWDGNMQLESCGNDCYPDFIAAVDANLGVNKSNYFLTRNLSMKVNIINKTITREMTISWKNRANPILAQAGQYKNYLRFYLPKEVKLQTLTSEEASINLLESADIKTEDFTEVGVYVQINPGQTKNLKLVWVSELGDDVNMDEYNLTIRKQAGTVADNLNYSFTSNTPIKSVFPAFGLTVKGGGTYNTTLNRDFESRINWK